MAYVAPMRARALSAVLALSGSVSCVADVVLPGGASSAACGNGVVESGEECDAAGAGCVACRVTPNYVCTGDGCARVCGDGVVGTGPTCLAPHRDSDCDMSGYWAARATAYERDAVIGAVQVSSSWALVRLEQRGDRFHVVEHLDCGVLVTGSATVETPSATLRALIWANRMDAPPHGPLRGTSRREGAGCAVSVERWYKVLGAADRYLPEEFAARPPLPSLPPLPSVEDPLSAVESPKGATDPDGDAIPGVAFDVSGIVSGTRSSAHREWTEYATTPGAPVSAAALSVVVPGAFDMEDQVLRITRCTTGCALLASSARAALDLRPRLSLVLIGKTPGSDRVREVVVGPPREDRERDVTTCANVRLVLPHDPSSPEGAP